MGSGFAILTMPQLESRGWGVARRPRLVAPGLLYHAIVCGNQRQKPFLTPDATGSLPPDRGMNSPATVTTL